MIEYARTVSSCSGCRWTPTASGSSCGRRQTAADGAGAHGIAPAGARFLVRPDGFVARRSTGAAADPTAELERASSDPQPQPLTGGAQEPRDDWRGAR